MAYSSSTARTMAGNLVYWKQCFHKVFVNHKNTRLLVDHHVHLLLIYLQTWKVQDNPDDWNPEDFKYHCLQSNGIPRKTLHRNEKAHKPTNHRPAYAPTETILIRPLHNREPHQYHQHAKPNRASLGRYMALPPIIVCQIGILSA